MMKRIHFLNLFILLLCTIACANNNHKEALNNEGGKTVKDTFELSRIINPVHCKTDPSQSFALYIPSSGKNKSLPVVYFFDPHGNGALPLAKYESLAEEYGFILVGSNNSKNGNDGRISESIWNILADDTRERLSVDRSRMYTCGFSGGGKMACFVALQHPEVKAVIANGGALAEITGTNSPSFPFTAIAGEGDMNMTDLVSITDALDNTRRHRIIFFDGKHEWAPLATMDIAMAGLQFDAMYEKLVEADQALIRNYTDNSKKKIAAFLKLNNYLKAEAECGLSISFLDGLPGDVNWFRQEDERIKNNRTFQKQLETRKYWLATEEASKDEFSKHFRGIDKSYWNKKVVELKAKAAIRSDEGAMNERLLAYLSLAFYTISNQLIAGNRNQEAQYFVDLYKLVDPANSEAWYFSALLNARNNNTKAAEEDLIKAVANGFTDRDRMRQQAEFRNVQVNFSAIESKMKKN